MASTRERLQARTDRRHLIHYASSLAVALSLAMALPTTQSEAQPLGRSLSQLETQSTDASSGVREGPDAARAASRSGLATRPAMGRRPPDSAFILLLVPGVTAGGAHTVASAAGGNGATISNLRQPVQKCGVCARAQRGCTLLLGTDVRSSLAHSSDPFPSRSRCHRRASFTWPPMPAGRAHDGSTMTTTFTTCV